MLFNKNGEGAVELQRITGVFRAANSYEVIASFVEEATRAVAARVGKEIVAEAETLYEAGEENYLLKAVRTPVAVLAVLRHSKSNLVSHEDRGLKVKADESEKIPFEWMVDRDERAQLERYYRAMDALYEYLEDSGHEAWMNSGIRSAWRTSIVPTLQDFERVYPVDGSYYVYYMLQSLVIESQSALRKILQNALWEKVKAAARGVSPDMQAAELLPLCQRWAVLSAIIKGVRRWSLEVFPLSVARRFAPSYQGNRESRTATQEEMDAYVAGLQEQLAETKEEIAEIMAGGNPWEDFNPMPENDRRNKFFTAQ